MSRTIPLGATRYAGNSDVVLPRLVEGALVAGVAVSMHSSNSSQPTVKVFDGTSFSGFSTHDLDLVRKTVGVIKTGEGVCLRLKEGSTLSIGDAFAVDNTTGEVVAAGSDSSTTIMGDIAEINVTGIDSFGLDVANCVLVNIYGGIAPAVSGGGSSGISDAPSDGSAYVRQDGAWVAETVGVEEAPTDGTPYVRQDADWVAETLPEPAVQSATVKSTKK